MCRSFKSETLTELVKSHRQKGAACSILSVRLENPTGYGRIVRETTNSSPGSSNKKTRRLKNDKLTRSTPASIALMLVKLFDALTQSEAGKRTGRILSDGRAGDSPARTARVTFMFTAMRAKFPASTHGPSLPSLKT